MGRLSPFMNLFQPYVLAARSMMMEGQWSGAMRYVEQGLSRYPYNQTLVSYRALIEYSRGNIELGDSQLRYLEGLQRRVPAPLFLELVHGCAVKVVRAFCSGETGELRKTGIQLTAVLSATHRHPFILVRVHVLMCLIASLLNDAELAGTHARALERFGRYYLIRPYLRYRAVALALHCKGNHESALGYMQRALDSVRFYHDGPMETVILYEWTTIRYTEEMEESTKGQLREVLTQALISASRLEMRPLQRRIERSLQLITAGETAHFHLTPREKEILNLVGEGLSNAAIAESLSLSSYTVANHLRNIFSKCGAQNRVAAYTIAKSRQLL
jgi:ATP/maltotriose-dependent transcriptional regulator MalT